ncbi:Type I secretion system ATP-binding protein PrsD [Roseovarius litorisediminis]|uniref:Type I secretion system ATP-binding protein PrsD n=1 Tax=Roseovarius litorisediminis TaxID=1312363 RepID=A0A1Y5RZ79_9RHOB|nr:type I secretion system permease/ATPase [Roseovarius litorisediminis]SLN28674.1 Type I secretion system ATP-binding protein PrsD [Roseovarius litorisediminis]
MNKTMIAVGHEELRTARRESRKLYWFVGSFSFFANLLMLTGPLYMLQVYDRVLGSRSVETLIALSVLVAFLYGIMALLDYARGRIMGRVGARFQSRLDQRVFDAVIRKSAVSPDEQTATGLRDLESVQRLMTSPVLTAMFDIPWTPFFLAGIWIFHPWLGVLALVGGLVLISVTFINQYVTRGPVANANRATVQSEAISNQIRTESEMVQAMGMRRAAFERWQIARDRSLKEQILSADLGGTFTSTTKAFRLFLQSAMLGVGAYLVLQNKMTPGAMIAGSILLGRALAPIEQVIGQWPLVQRASKGWTSLAELLGSVPPEVSRTELPVPRALLEVQQVTVIPPGEQQAALKTATFTLQPGQAVGVIGPSGAGKSTLARALTGVWRPAGGKIRLDGASLEQYAPEVLGQHIGYLPQRVQLFDGTIAENIARLSGHPDAEKVVAAARKADAHEMILKLPDGYDTRVTAGGGRLSGGQMQRIGLARAMYGDPVLLVLDEPNSNLDNEGSEAVNNAIRSLKAEGKSILIMAHRPAAIKECDLLLVLENGVVRAFGPKEKVLREVVHNHSQIANAPGLGGVQ